MAAVTICSDSGAQENKVCHCFHYFPICLSWSDGTGCLELSFLNVDSQASFLFFSLFFFTFIKRLFSSSLLSAIRKQCYLHIWCYWFSPSNPDSSLCFIQPSIFHDVLCITGWKYTALTYSFPNLEPVCCSNSSNCCFLTCIQISQEEGGWSGIPISWRIFQFVVIHTKALA